MKHNHVIPSQVTQTRNFLFLQGPASPFLRVLAKKLEARGASVCKINFCLGDIIFWRKWPIHVFRQKKALWPQFLEHFIRSHGITDILMLGDGRPHHHEAIALARHLGVKVHIFEHGYLRPDWLTVEPWGMSSQSCFPVEREKILNLVQFAPKQLPHQPYGSSFLHYALYDLAFHLPNLALGWAFTPHYRAHGGFHPVVEYAGWIGKAFTRKRRVTAARALEARLLASDAPFFLMPLQLPGDYQIRKHAPFGDLFLFVRAIIGSFAAHLQNAQDCRTRLVFKVHPIDNGLSGWQRRIAGIARHFGVEDRVDLIDGGDLSKLIAASKGVVTVNSTVGLTALQAQKPVIALAPALYDIEGLTHQASLAEFWAKPQPPEPAHLEALIPAMLATIQIRGGFIGRRAIEEGAENMASHLLTPSLLPEQPSAGRGIYRYEAELRPYHQ